MSLHNRSHTHTCRYAFIWSHSNENIGTSSPVASSFSVLSPCSVLGGFHSGSRSLGHTPSTAGTFRKKFRKNSGISSGNALRAFPGSFPSRVRLGCSKPYSSRHLRLPEHFQNCLLPSTAGGASFFRSGSGEGLPEPVMEFPAVLGVFLSPGTRKAKTGCERWKVKKSLGSSGWGGDRGSI